MHASKAGTCTMHASNRHSLRPCPNARYCRNDCEWLERPHPKGNAAHPGKQGGFTIADSAMPAALCQDLVGAVWCYLRQRRAGGVHTTGQARGAVGAAGDG